MHRLILLSAVAVLSMVLVACSSSAKTAKTAPTVATTTVPVAGRFRSQSWEALSNSEITFPVTSTHQACHPAMYWGVVSNENTDSPGGAG